MDWALSAGIPLGGRTRCGRSGLLAVENALSERGILRRLDVVLERAFGVGPLPFRPGGFANTLYNPINLDIALA